MAFFSLSTEAKSFAYAIQKFQYNTRNNKVFRINSTLQKLVNRVVATELINPLLFSISKRKTKVVASVSSGFYNFSRLTNADKLLKPVAHFKKITTNSQVKNSSLQQSKTSTVASAVGMAIANIQAKHKNKMHSI